MAGPEKTFKAGAVSAKVWSNLGAKGEYKTVTLERTYKDKQGNWQNSSSLRVTDIPKAQLVLSKVFEQLVLEA
ncbi:MAG: hypothetical protein ABIA93_00085 [Candidatus Woesearchaeota archaeon]